MLQGWKAKLSLLCQGRIRGTQYEHCALDSDAEILAVYIYKAIFMQFTARVIKGHMAKSILTILF